MTAAGLIVQTINSLQFCTGPEVIKLFSCLTQLSMKFIMFINVKMPTIFGILIFMSMVNTTSEHLKASERFIFKHYRFYEHLKFHAQLSSARKMLYDLGTRFQTLYIVRGGGC